MTIKRTISVCAALVAILMGTHPASALSLKQVLKDLDNLVQQVAKLPNPITTPIQIVTGNQNPLKVKEYIAAQGQAIDSIVVSTRNLNNVPADAAGQLASKVGGDKASIVFEILTGSQRLQQEVYFTATQQAAAMLQGQDPLIALALPMAQAIRDAHSKFDAQAKPLPDDVKQLLGVVIPPDIVNRGRYTVGDLKISLPTAIAAVRKGTAVTVDDIMVFPREPDFNDIGDLAWVSHELFHVKQFRDWGIDQFAFNYLKNNNAVEDQAYAAQSYTDSFLRQVANRQPINPQVTYMSASAYATTPITTPLGQTTVFVKADATETLPGKPEGGSVIQPVLTNKSTAPYAAVCNLDGESLFIDQANAVIAPLRGNIEFGRKIKPPLDPRCHFDLQFPGGRACAMERSQPDPQTGVMLYIYEVYFGNHYSGQCSGCTTASCPQ